jgi:hypothetical protein
MKFKFIIFLFLFFSLLTHKNTLNAQWLHFCQFPNPQTPGVNLLFGDADFFSPDSGFYYYNVPSLAPSGSSGSVLYRTLNETSTWDSSYLMGGIAAGFTNFFNCRKFKTIYFVEIMMGLSSLKKSSDGGTTWINYGGIPSFVRSIFTCDTSKLYAIYRFQTIGYYLFKYDNGIKYNKYYTFNSIIPGALFFPDTTTGFISAKDSVNNKVNLILKTTDGGLNWNSVFIDSTINIRNLYFPSGITGYAVGDSGRAIKTSNGGINWQLLNTGTSVNLNSLYFLNDSVGFAAGDSGVIIRTMNGGLNWTQDVTGTTNQFTKIFFVNDSIGFALINWKMYRVNLNSSIGIWELVSKPQPALSVYPNPSAANITIDIPEELKKENNLLLRFFDNTGKLILSESFIGKSDYIYIKHDNIPRGIYLVILSGNSKNYQNKLIIN